MATQSLRLLTAATLAAVCIGAAAQEQPKEKKASDIALHGSVQADVLFPEGDDAIGLKPDEHKILFNTYADLNMISRYVDAGIRFEYMKFPLPGYDSGFGGYGIPNIYAKGKYKGVELTVGDFYDQFGAGFIFRTYEERTLGIDNSLRGARLKINSVPGLRVTLLGGTQRTYWYWGRSMEGFDSSEQPDQPRTSNQVWGANVEVDISEYSSAMKDNNLNWTVGGSYVLKHEGLGVKDIPNTSYRLNFPKYVSAFDFRTHLQRNAWGVDAEYAWKSQDPSFDNGYIYRNGSALMLTGTYTKTGLSALVKVKRSDNMAFRSQRGRSDLAGMINNMPAFAYQQTYALAAKYPYATQTANGEWAFQAAFAYNFKRKTALGGKYGTKVKLNLSYIRGLDKGPKPEGINGSTWGTNGAGSKFFGFGPQYYRDINIQIEKKFTRDFQLMFMYMNQYNFDVTLEDFHGDVKANIFVLDGKYKFDKRFTLRAELQYLTTHQANKDWAYGLLELSVAPYLMFTVSDQWNCGDTGVHYYMAGVAGNYKSNRLMLSYGRTPMGFDCSGGVCRRVPKTRGFRIAYTYNF
ncbi:MAG: hypothetical protein K2L80_00170 [Muribaculaceae bacterium]|nr:hypothetical protein [Muribaculaceae bacterium]